MNTPEVELRIPFHRRAALAVAGAVLLAGPAAAQKSDIEARAEIAFARGLASEWGFVDLSEEVIAGLEKAGVSEKIGEELGLLKCEVYYIAAQSDKVRREELLQKSIAAYEDFIERNAYSSFIGDAEANLIDVSSYYARSLALQLEDAAGEEAQVLRDEMQRVLDGAVDKTGKLVSDMKSIPPDERTEADRRKLYGLLHNRGQLLLELAKTQEDGTYSFQKSFDAFEDLADEAGEASPWGLRAFIGIGDNRVAEGEYDEAAGYYEFVVEMAITRDANAWSEAREEMPQGELEQRFFFMQNGVPGLVDSLARAGRSADAASWGLHFYNTWSLEGLNLTQPVGHLAMLAVARTLVDAGGVVGGPPGGMQWFQTDEEAAGEFDRARDRRPALDAALSMAQEVNNENKGNTLQLRAQKVISEIISRPGVQVDPEILFEAAQGEFYERNYSAAIPAFKRVLSSLEGQDLAKRAEIGPKTLWHIGRSFQQLDRTIEAAVTFEEAISDRWRGDPQYDAQNAESFYDTMQVLRRRSKEDALIQSMWRRAEEMAKLLTETKGAEVVFRHAMEKYDEAEAIRRDDPDRAQTLFREALQAFEKVEPAAESFEKSLVFVGVCHYKLGQLDQAEQALDAYLNTYLDDPINQTTDPRKLAKRSEARAVASFYWGLAELKREDWAGVVEKLANFHQRFPDQTSYAPAALYRVMIAHTKQDDNPSARAVYEEMLKVFPDSPWTGRCATDFYKILKARHEAEEDAERKRGLLVEMAEALEVLNSTSATPSFNNMRQESRHWIDLEDWAKAEALLVRIRDQFSEGEEGSEVRKYVLPDLGLTYLRQYKVQEAADELAELVESQSANRQTARIYALALAGWLEAEEEGGRTVIKQAPGAGGDEGFTKATEILNQLTEASETWETEWFQRKLELIYAYYQWGQMDGKKLDTAKTQIEFLANPANLGPQFKHDLMPEPLRQKYVWLHGELK